VTAALDTRTTTADHPLLEVRNLSVIFRPRGARPVYAVDDVSLTVAAGETVGLVGESGSGKTTLGQAILGLQQPSLGSIFFDGRDITSANRAIRRDLSRELQVVFQDPYGSLSPTRTIGQTLVEPLLAHHSGDHAQKRQRAIAMLTRVGLGEDAMSRYPSEFSGGQRQRIAIARALMLSPRMVICDEPVSALDLSVQAQVLNLLRHLQDELSLSYLFVAHNLAVVRHVSNRIFVLYRGRVMESGPADIVYRSPAHPYTRALLDAAPIADPDVQAGRRALRAREPAAHPPPTGSESCPFVNRCAHAIAQCGSVRPPLVPTPSGTMAACIRIGELPERAPSINPVASGAIPDPRPLFSPSEGFK